MAKTLPISATQSLFLPIRNTVVKTLQLAGAAATSVIEFFDGTIDGVASVTASAGGTSYVVGDLLTLVAGENGNSESRATVRVTVVDHNSASSSISSSASSSVSPSPSESGSASASLSRSSSVSSSPSRSVSSSPSSSVSPSSSISPSASVSHSPSASASPSASLSNSVSSSLSSSASRSISSSPSSSISSSPSPSGAGPGAVTSVEIISAGGGYTAGNTYATTGGTGSGCTIYVNTVADQGTSFGKLQCVANESAAPVDFGSSGSLTTKGVSVRISGTSAKGFITYE